MVCEHDEVIDAVGADWELDHVVSVELANELYPNIEFFFFLWWSEVALVPLLWAALWSWWIKRLVATVLCDLGVLIW